METGTSLNGCLSKLFNAYFMADKIVWKRKLFSHFQSHLSATCFKNKLEIETSEFLFLEDLSVGQNKVLPS